MAVFFSGLSKSGSTWSAVEHRCCETIFFPVSGEFLRFLAESEYCKCIVSSTWCQSTHENMIQLEEKARLVKTRKRLAPRGGPSAGPATLNEQRSSTKWQLRSSSPSGHIVFAMSKLVFFVYSLPSSTFVGTNPMCFFSVFVRFLWTMVQPKSQTVSQLRQVSHWSGTLTCQLAFVKEYVASCKL